MIITTELRYVVGMRWRCCLFLTLPHKNDYGKQTEGNKCISESIPYLVVQTWKFCLDQLGDATSRGEGKRKISYKLASPDCLVWIKQEIHFHTYHINRWLKWAPHKVSSTVAAVVSLDGLDTSLNREMIKQRPHDLQTTHPMIQSMKIHAVIGCHRRKKFDSLPNTSLIFCMSNSTVKIIRHQTTQRSEWASN